MKRPNDSPAMAAVVRIHPVAGGNALPVPGDPDRSAKRLATAVRDSFLALAIGMAAAFAAEPLAPCALSISGDRLYLACGGAKKIGVFALPSGAAEKTMDLPFAATGVAVEGPNLLVTGNDGALWIEISTGRTVKAFPAGSGAHAPTIGPGERFAVVNRFANTVLLGGPGGHRTVEVSREPMAAAFTRDGAALFVANLLPAGRADVDPVAAEISVIDTATGAVGRIPLPSGSTSVCDLSLSHDGALVYAVHLLARYTVPTTQVEKGWMNTAALTIIDAARRTVTATVLLDDVVRGAANPSRVLATADGASILVLHQGTHELSVIPREALFRKIAAFSNATPLSDELSFMAGLRRRIPIPGQGLRSMALHGGKVWVAGYFSATLHGVDTVSGAVSTLPLQPGFTPTPAWRGEALFGDATLCFQQWQSCASCHPDARVDGLNWDLLNDGIGNPKNVRSLLHVFRRSPVMSHGIRATAEVAVRSGIKYILFATRPESDAVVLDAFLKNLAPRASPALVGGRLSPTAERGKALFNAPEVGCAACHSGPLYTDMKLREVGTRGVRDTDADFITPSLLEAWGTAPYLHDGRFATLKECIGPGNRAGRRGKTAQLSGADLDALVEYVRSL